MQQAFQQRRHNFLQQMQANSAALFFSAPEATRSRDTHYPYRQESNFWYLTGFAEPEAVLLLIKQAGQTQSILFNRPNDPQAEIWTGRRLGQAQACQTLHVDQAYSITELHSRLSQYLNQIKTIYHADGENPSADQLLSSVLQTLRADRQAQAPDTLIDWRPMLHTMRLIKSPAEIAELRQAGHISALAHRRAMQRCRAGMYEYQLEAEILYTFMQHGARAPAYNTIVAGGNNACILHYEQNDQLLQDGELVLIDAGCEYHYYAGDITRTFPVNGKFSAAQRELYNLVLSAQQYALDHLLPGATISAVNQQVQQILVSGLVQLGILAGEVEQLLADKAYLPYYMHGLGHWLGIDVHDVGDYQTQSGAITLQTGMVLTVEPGLYIAQDAKVPPAYQGIGIRIEDNIVITESGNEILTADVPKDPDEIEQLMAQKLNLN